MSTPADAPNIGIAFRRQWIQAKGPQPKVQCAGCEVAIPIRFLFRCLYCGLWFCQTCGEDHFGEKRADREKRRATESGVLRSGEKP